MDFENMKIGDLTVAQFRILMNNILDEREAEKARPKNQVRGYIVKGGSAHPILGAPFLGSAGCDRLE